MCSGCGRYPIYCAGCAARLIRAATLVILVPWGWLTAKHLYSNVGPWSVVHGAFHSTAEDASDESRRVLRIRTAWRCCAHAPPWPSQLAAGDAKLNAFHSVDRFSLSPFFLYICYTCGDCCAPLVYTWLEALCDKGALSMPKAVPCPVHTVRPAAREAHSLPRVHSYTPPPTPISIGCVHLASRNPPLDLRLDAAFTTLYETQLCHFRAPEQANKANNGASLYVSITIPPPSSSLVCTF